MKLQHGFQSITFLLIFTVAITVYGQKSEVMEKLGKYNITEEFFENYLSEFNTKYSFDYKSTSISASSNILFEAVYDKTKPEGERWKLISENGSKPDDKIAKIFEKDNNKRDGEKFGEPIPEEWKVITDDASNLVIRFKFDNDNVPKSIKYLSDCEAKLFIDKNSGTVNYVEFSNLKKIKVSIMSITSFNLKIYFDKSEDGKDYIIKRKENITKGKFLGQEAENKTIEEFTNYKKVINN